MNRRYGRLTLRALVIGLLLLAVSPVTAPFSTYDLSDLFGVTPSDTPAIVHSKAAPDEPTAMVTGSVGIAVVVGASADAPGALAPQSRAHLPFHLPLRI